jgi:hypothetical protein
MMITSYAQNTIPNVNMNNYFIPRLLYTLVMLMVAISFFIISKKIVGKTNYTGSIKIFLTIIVASICSLLFFYPCAILDNQF